MRQAALLQPVPVFVFLFIVYAVIAIHVLRKDGKRFAEGLSQILLSGIALVLIGLAVTGLADDLTTWIINQVA